MKRRVLGPRAVVEALRAAPKRVAVVYIISDATTSLREVEALARKAGVRVEARARQQLDALCRGQRHQGVVAISGDYPYLDVHQLLEGCGDNPLLVALDQVADPHNFGAIVRSAVAFGADGVLTLKDRAAPVTPVVVRTSAGATEAARIARVVNLARTLGNLRDIGMQIVGLDAAGDRRLDQLDPPNRGRVLVIGSEGRGLRRLVAAQCDTLTRIDLPGALHSLNASVAAGIAIYESARARLASPEPA